VALLDPVLGAAATRLRASLPGRHPPVRRDLAFFVPEGVTHRQVEEALLGTGGEMLASIELFDVYAGPGTPEGMKSLAFALEFQHPERTLAESEVQATQERMVAAVAGSCGGRLREK
jgi:phenylalanyl-tRNA synthetase beta chain